MHSALHWLASCFSRVPSPPTIPEPSANGKASHDDDPHRPVRTITHYQGGQTAWVNVTDWSDAEIEAYERQLCVAYVEFLEGEWIMRVARAIEQRDWPGVIDLQNMANKRIRWIFQRNHRLKVKGVTHV